MAFTQQTPIGTPDFNLITKTLAGLQPDSALQQYAMLHKNNPYILSLAKSESDRRKTLRTAAQGNPGQMPTVADREIAGMAPAPMMAQQQLPENQGIAQIPTPNMRTLADGGIAGYADDEEGMATGGMGGMFNFAQQSEPVVRMSGGGAIGFASGGGGRTEVLRAVLKELNEPFQNYLNNEKTRKAVDQLVQERLNKTATTAKPTAAPSAAPSKAFEAGQKYGPTIKKVGDTLSDIGTTKTSKLPLNTGAKTAGVLGLGAGLYEGYKAGDFYNDPNVSDVDKALQAGRTASRAGLPMVGAGFGSFFTPVGTAVGTLAGTAAAYAIDEEGDALKAWRKANPQATPEQTKKAVVALAPAYDGPKLNAAQAERAVTGQPTVTPIPEAKPNPNAGGVKDLFPAPPKLDTSFKPVAAPTTEDATTLGNKFTNLDARTNTINSQVAQKRSDITTAAENRVAALQAFNEKQGPAYAGYEKLLQKEELQDATDKDKAGLMSLMKGFLAMAAGESPNAATNIAKGAMVGMGDYGDALKEFKKSAKERNKEMQNIENARRAESRGNFDKAEMYEYQADQNRIAATDAGIAAISKVTDTSAAVSAGLYSDSLKLASDQNIAAMKERGLNARSIYDQSSQNARAQMLTGDGRTAMMLGSGKTDAERLESGMKKLQEITADKSGMAAVKLLAETNAKLQAAGQPPVTMADLLGGAREFSALMYPKVGNDAPTRAR